nr:MAG TPA: hypothetical protein [Caudoviricetes sp.]
MVIGVIGSAVQLPRIHKNPRPDVATMKTYVVRY